MDYMESGGPVYVEGCDIGFNNATSDIWPYFGAAYLGDGSVTGNVSSVRGASGSFAEQLAFGYPFAQGPDSYVDVLGPAAGQLLLLDQADTGRAVVYAAGPYRAVVSSLIAGALRASDRDEFITACASYLVEGIGIAGPKTAAQARPLVLSPNPVRGHGSVRLSRPTTATATLYDAGGRPVRTLPAGAAEFSAQGLAAGAYLLQTDGPVLPLAVLR
jgi:hypothetical protein